MNKHDNDYAITRDSLYGTTPETTYAGITSFMRRKYTKDLGGVDVAVTGVPLDTATTNRPGARFGPRAVRNASSIMAWEKPYGMAFDPFDKLAVADAGDCFFDFGKPESVPDAIEARAFEIIDAGPALLQRLQHVGRHAMAAAMGAQWLARRLNYSELEDSALDLIVAGTDNAVLMVESQAKILSEEVMLGAVTFGHEQMQTAIGVIKELAEEMARANGCVIFGSRGVNQHTYSTQINRMLDALGYPDKFGDAIGALVDIKSGNVPGAVRNLVQADELLAVLEEDHLPGREPLDADLACVLRHQARRLVPVVAGGALGVEHRAFAVEVHRQVAVGEHQRRSLAERHCGADHRVHIAFRADPEAPDVAPCHQCPARAQRVVQAEPDERIHPGVALPRSRPGCQRQVELQRDPPQPRDQADCRDDTASSAEKDSGPRAFIAEYSLHVT